MKDTNNPNNDMDTIRSNSKLPNNSKDKVSKPIIRKVRNYTENVYQINEEMIDESIKQEISINE